MTNIIEYSPQEGRLVALSNFRSSTLSAQVEVLHRYWSDHPSFSVVQHELRAPISTGKFAHFCDSIDGTRAKDGLDDLMLWSMLNRDKFAEVHVLAAAVMLSRLQAGSGSVYTVGGFITCFADRFDSNMLDALESQLRYICARPERQSTMDIRPLVVALNMLLSIEVHRFSRIAMSVIAAHSTHNHLSKRTSFSEEQLVPVRTCLLLAGEDLNRLKTLLD